MLFSSFQTRLICYHMKKTHQTVSCVFLPVFAWQLVQYDQVAFSGGIAVVLAMPCATKMLTTQREEGDGAGIACASPGEQLCKAHTLCLCMKVQTSRYMDNHRAIWVGRDSRLEISQVSY